MSHEYLSLAESKYYAEFQWQRILGYVVSKLLAPIIPGETTEGSPNDCRLLEFVKGRPVF